MKPCKSTVDYWEGDLVYNERTRKYYVVYEDCGERGLYARRWIGEPGAGYEYGERKYIKTDYCKLIERDGSEIEAQIARGEVEDDDDDGISAELMAELDAI